MGEIHSIRDGLITETRRFLTWEEALEAAGLREQSRTTALDEKRRFAWKRPSHRLLMLLAQRSSYRVLIPARQLGFVPGAEETLRSAYRAFSARDIDAAVQLMHPEVDWPNAWEGGRVVGHAAVRDY